MHQQSDLLQINVKINLEVNVVDITKNKLKIKIHQTTIRSRHAPNLLQYGCVAGEIKIITIW